jgi:hypothetical protein
VLPFQAVVYSITFSSSGGDSKIFQLISFMCVVILQVINFFRWCVCVVILQVIFFSGGDSTDSWRCDLWEFSSGDKYFQVVCDLRISVGSGEV